MAAEHVCDIARLRKSNDLQWKWFQRTGQYKNTYISWVLDLKKDPQKFKKTLSPAFKSAFSKDLKSMFYAAEVENDIVTHYMAMVKYVLNKLKFAENSYDDLYSLGLIAIRNCIWQYRNIGVKCSFTTYCHNSIWMRLKGDLSKEETKFKRRKKYTIIMKSADMNDKFDIENIASSEKEVQIDESSEFLGKLKEKLDLKEDEAFLFECLLRRELVKKEDGVWYKPYLEKFRHTFPNQRISKEGMRLRTLKLQKKIWHHWHNIQGLPVLEMPKPKMGRSL